MVDFPKILKGFSGLSNRDNIHIFRDPPKSIYTRKKERVEWGDVKAFVENDTSRYDEGLLKFNKGVNPSVAVEYQNTSAGSRTTTLPNREAKNPYTVMKEGSFRPPLFRQEDLLPLSRMNRPYTHIDPKPGVRNSFVNCGLSQNTDMQPIMSAVSVRTSGEPELPPTASYIIQTPTPINCESNIKFDKQYDTINQPKSTSVKAEYFDDEFAKSIQDQQLKEGHLPSEANKENLVKASSSSVSGLKDLQQNRDISTNIKEFTLLEELSTNPSLNIYDPNNKNMNVSGINDENINIEISSNPQNINKLQRLHMEYELDRKNQLISAFAPQHNKDKLINNYNPNYNLDKNIELDKLTSTIKYDYHKPGEQRLDKEYKKQIREINGSTTPSHFIKRDNEEILMNKRENYKLKKQTHYTNFGASPNVFTLDRQGITTKLKK